MKRIILVLLVLSLVFSIVACGGGSGDSDVAGTNDATEQDKVIQDETTKQIKEDDQIIKDDIVVVFETGIEAEFSISDEDYNKYNEIMYYLNKYPEKSEAALFEELAETYGESPEELTNFINDNMQDAIARDMAGNTVVEEDIDNLVSKFVEENIVGESVSVNSIDSETQGVGSISNIDLEVDGNRHNLIVKFRFSNDYKTAEVIQVKVDGLNINLK
ncbi:hypothetical protein NE686_00575 [Tissierella carlieri]|uniref:Lipoprotein n=1 Tax=Tissierella carlieri TaxID=689904 RepID=A0ABT1S519_9FIRM|nr:hypothetical protein [Tissierella carlieri]MCQ4921563.1 hypothetical protein [Tissierella carlieri]